MNISRFIIKIIFHASKPPLRIIEFFDARLYMSIYKNLLSKLGVKFLGQPRYISSSATFDDFEKITFGNDVVVSKNVVFLTHDYSVTTGLKSINCAPKTDIAFLKPIIIGNNVFLGMNVFLTPGVEIGSNVVVGSGTVLRGKIPSNSVISGNPGVVICKLDEAAIRWKNKLDTTKLRIDRK